MHTVISAFDDSRAARDAAERLVQGGFPREDVHLRTREAMEASAASAAEDAADDRVTAQALASPEREVAVGPHALAAIDHFFDRLLGRDEHAGHAKAYSEAVRRGGTVVVVDAATPEQADRAAQLMHEMGAFDIGERARQWQQEGWVELSAGEEPLAGGGTVRWRAARIVQRASGQPLREIVRDGPPRGEG